MIEVVRTLELSETPSAVWARIGAFKAIGCWHPAVASAAISLADGRERRTLTLTDGATLVEDRIDDGGDRFAYEYQISEGPLPVANYTSSFSVEPHGMGSKITWRGVFNADGTENGDAEAIIAGVYEGGLNAIAEGA